MHRWASYKVSGFALTRDDFGHTLLVDLDNHIDLDIYLRGSYETEYLKLMEKWARVHRDVEFVDVGANIGAFSIYFGDNPIIKKVYAFEPDPKNFAQLQANVFLNYLAGNVELHNLALSHENGHADFYLARGRQQGEYDKLNTGTSSLDFNPNRHEKGTSVRVDVRRGDDMLAQRNQDIVLKIDVEGHELGVLQGMTEFLSSNNCLLFIEVWRHQIDLGKQVHALLGELGYTRCSHPSIDDTDNRLYMKQPFDFDAV